MKRSLLFAVAVAGVLAFAGNAFAGDALLSPKAKELADSLRKVPGTTTDMIDRSAKAASPKALDLAHSVRKVPGSTPDMIARNLPPLPPRLLANEPWRIQQFPIAPVK